MTEGNVAVLIDYENVGLDAIQYLLDQMSDVGRVIIKRAYADWSAERDKRDQLLELGIEPIHIFRSTSSGKNSSDIRLAIDAVDLLYGASVDTFVIASSDSDFVPLVSKLRAAGKSAIGAGRREAVSPTLVRSCDRYIYLDDAKAAGERGDRKAQPGSREAEVSSTVVRAIEASIDDQGQVLGSKLHETLRRIDPGFNYRSLGYKTFGDFLDSRQEVKVTRPRDASDQIVQLNTSRQRGGVGSEGPVPASNWDREVDAAWSRRQRRSLSGQLAAADAAKVLGVPRLRDSRFRSLDKLLAASEHLQASWRRDGNAIIRK